MLDVEAVEELARPIIQRAVAQDRLEELRVAPTTDADGDDAFQVTAVVSRLRAEALDARIDASVALQDALGRAGEGRYAYLRFVTAKDLLEDAENA